MIRVLVLVLVAANLLFWGWSRWVKEEKPRLVAPPPVSAGTLAVAQAQRTSPAPCTSLGPFQDEVRAKEVEQLLRDMQLVPSRRNITREAHDDWWVYLDNADAAAQARSLRLIQAAGLRDAVALPDDPAFRVSVGIFREEAGARSRAQAVRELGLVPVVGERTKEQTSLWFELPGTGVEAVDMTRLAAEGVNTQALELRACMPADDLAGDATATGGNSGSPGPAQ